MRWASAVVRLSLLGIAIHVMPGMACGQAGIDTKSNTATVPEARDGSALALHESFLERAAEGEIDLLFLGDSITQGWNENPVWQRYYGSRNAANFGIGGDRTQHVLWRLQHGEIAGINPRVIVLMIGTNNISGNTPEEIAEGVEAIVDRLASRLPDAHVLLLGVFPRGASRPTEGESADQDLRVREINELIEPLGRRESVTYLDIGASFLDDEGKIPRELMPDYLHLSRKGYNVWAEAMEPTLWELMSETD